MAFFDIDGSLVHYPQTLEKWGDITGPSVLPGCFMYVDKVRSVEGVHAEQSWRECARVAGALKPSVVFLSS